MSGFKKPSGVEVERIFGPDAEAPHYWWTKIDFIAGNGYNLATGRYKPQMEQKPPGEAPVIQIKETLAIEKQMVKDLENFLKELGYEYRQ